jgi:hypothetical protein
MQLDECDNAILAVPVKQGRISNRDLAGRSESAGRERERRLAPVAALDVAIALALVGMMRTSRLGERPPFGSNSA